MGSLLSAQQYQTGVVLDSLAVADSSNETFALYLPTSYAPNKLSPILFIFSPSANGRNAIKAFEKAAETYNYILVCSNNARNGPINRNLDIAQRLFDHIFANFTIREHGIYLAGFSGGSRLASTIATLSGEFEGVIACGAGFSSVPAYRPSTQNFLYAGICGNKDMNYKEMIGVETYLNRLNFRNTLFTFDGGHKWPPNEQIIMAFNWLEIESLKKGHLKKADSEVLKSYTKNLEGAKTAVLDKQLLLAAEYYKRAVKTYGSFFNLDSVRQKLKDIQRNNEYISALKSREKAFKKETVLTSSFLNRFDRDYENPEEATLNWWTKAFEKLNKQGAKDDSEFGNMIERLRFKVFVAAYMKTNSDRSTSSESQVAFCKALVSKLYPK